MNTGKLKQRLEAQVLLEVLDKQGRRVEMRERDCDLVTNNWLQWAGALSLPFRNTNYLSLVLDNGMVYTYEIGSWSSSQFSNYLCKPKISIGNGVTPPSGEDYKLANEIARSEILTPSSWSNPQTGRFEAVFFYTFASNVPITVSEVGLFVYSITPGRDILLARDLIDPPIQVPAGGAVKVTYYLVMAVVRG